MGATEESPRIFKETVRHSGEAEEHRSRGDSEALHRNLPRLLPSTTCFPLLFIFLRHRANMKAARWPLYPARFKRKKGKLGEKDSAPESLPARLGRGSTAIKGRVYLRGDAAEYSLNSAELKQLSRKPLVRSISIILEDIILSNNGNVSRFNGAFKDSLSRVG